MNRALLLSPHPDDAVFACGEWLLEHPGTTVVTVFAGTPPGDRPATAWDRRCGFDSAAQAMCTRRDEDRRALEGVGAVPVWGPFLDDQYGDPPEVAALVRWLAVQMVEQRPATLLLPLGLYHRDHLRVADAALQALRAKGDAAPTVLAYEDVPYRAIPGLLQQRLADLLSDGWHATPLPCPTRAPDPRKRAAIGCYASQLRVFGADGPPDAARPERLWTLARALPPLPA